MTPLQPAGLAQLASSGDVSETVRRLRSAIERRGMSVFAHIDHAAAAAAAGLELQPMQVVVFGAASAGTKLMQIAPTIGIDLPLRVLVWRDQAGGTMLAYNDPAWLVGRHDDVMAAGPVVATMRAALADIAAEATRSNALGAA